ncbi:hypothetical protein [Nesterenkonia massiliensis]|uniref:hypothetical protein n=1 Tax=Nesterenkonia massiliensis TaxID=1232429 RepID=UPI000403BA2E|nr:hypothetical protein [Nesterenkonia massiliensis]
MPQISKGDRIQVSSRLELPYFEKLTRYLEITGESKNDYVRALIIRDLDSIDLEALERDQQRLPISA